LAFRQSLPPTKAQQSTPSPARPLRSSWSAKQAHPRTPSPMPDPQYRQYDGEEQWPNGVLSGGMVIDLLECLSASTRTPDYALFLWLKAHYVEPFGRIERLDGLVVAETQD
jgi:hypothetical protein